MGNFRYSTPTTGLEIIMGQLPLDLHILETAMRTHVRLAPLSIRDWNGKGPGSKGRPGHILRMEKLMQELQIIYAHNDSIPKEKSWKKKLRRFRVMKAIKMKILRLRERPKKSLSGRSGKPLKMRQRPRKKPSEK